MPTQHVMTEGTQYTRCGYRVVGGGSDTANAATGMPIVIVASDPTCGRCRRNIAIEARAVQNPTPPQTPVTIDWLKLAKDIAKAIDDQLYANEVVDLLRRHGMTKSANPEVLAWAKVKEREGA